MYLATVDEYTHGHVYIEYIHIHVLDSSKLSPIHTKIDCKIKALEVSANLK